MPLMFVLRSEGSEDGGNGRAAKTVHVAILAMYACGVAVFVAAAWLQRQQKSWVVRINYFCLVVVFVLNVVIYSCRVQEEIAGR